MPVNLIFERFQGLEGYSSKQICNKVRNMRKCPQKFARFFNSLSEFRTAVREAFPHEAALKHASVFNFNILKMSYVLKMECVFYNLNNL